MNSVDLVRDIANCLVKFMMLSSLYVSNFGVNNALADIYKRSILSSSAVKTISKSCGGISRINIRKDERMCVQLSAKELTMDDNIFSRVSTMVTDKCDVASKEGVSGEPAMYGLASEILIGFSRGFNDTCWTE